MANDQEKTGDSIISDVRRARQKVLAQHGGDVRRLVGHLMDVQAQQPKTVVNLRQRKAEAVDRCD